MNPKLETVCKQFLPKVKETGAFIHDHFRRREFIHFKTKGKNDLVSAVDKEAELQLVNAAKEIFPTAGFLTEEGTIQSSENEYQWIIDPLDGTTNFYYGIPFFAVSVALIHNRKPILGIVYDVTNQDMFYAWKDGGFFVNDEQTYCSGVDNTGEAFLATGIPNFDFENVPAYLNSLNKIITCTRGIRRLGSAALELAYVAAGRFDAFFETGLKPWDVAASICLIQEAGGVVTDLSGGRNYLFGSNILAASEKIHAELLENLTR